MHDTVREKQRTKGGERREKKGRDAVLYALYVHTCTYRDAERNLLQRRPRKFLDDENVRPPFKSSLTARERELSLIHI